MILSSTNYVYDPTVEGNSTDLEGGGLGFKADRGGIDDKEKKKEIPVNSHLQSN